METAAIALAIVCKAPVEGACKTRLSPPLSAREAAELSGCFIADVATAIAGVVERGVARGYAVYTPADQAAAFAPIVPPDFGLLAQRGDDLSDRLLHAIDDLLAAGHGGLCLINGDSPTLPPSLLVRAVASLRQPGDRVVLCPAIDGGYCLIGVKRAHAALFRGIAWSTAQVLAQTLARIAALSLPATLLPTWYDVDDHASLQLLLHELFGTGIALAVEGALGAPAERSRRYLAALLRAGGGSRLGFASPPGTAVT